MIKKLLITAIILLFIGINVIPSTGTTLKQRSSLPTISGNTLYVGGIGPDNYTSIQAAINDANDGDTVYVYDDSSPYYENVVVNKTISLIGENKNKTTIDGNSSGNVVYVSANLVSISCFTIRNGGKDGILIRSNHNTISGNTILNNDDGINYHNSNNNIIMGNTISNNWKGISGSGKKNIIIGNNICLNNDDGIFCLYGTNNNLLNNTISMNNGHGISFGQFGAEFPLSVTSSTISGNAISYNSGSGINLLGSSHNSIFDNYILGNKCGLNFGVAFVLPGIPSLPAFSNYNIVYHNNVTNNDYGIKFDFLCRNNRICYNIFKENTKNVYDNFVNIWYNPVKKEGNYWDDYIGEDKDGDGIGDTPYNIPPIFFLNKDRFPYMESDDIENVVSHQSIHPSSQQFSVSFLLRSLENFPLLEIIINIMGRYEE